MNMLNNNNERVSETGSALVYILIAIALLAALTASFMRPSNQQTTAQSSFNAITEIKSQIEFIRSSIQECVLIYPAGETGSTAFNQPYPINPTNTQFTTPALTDELRLVGCPGNPGDANDHAPIFGGNSGKFLPPPPALFEEWQYHNGVDGVFFYIRTDKTDAFLQTALAKLDENYSDCQADVIQAPASGGNVELTSTAATGDSKCDEGGTCFRLWVIIHPSAVYPDGC